MKAPLYLTARGSLSPVWVPAKITEFLHSHHIESLRFIYHSYIKSRNVIIDNELEMNAPLLISAFLAAVKSFPALLVCPDALISYWAHEFKSKGRFHVYVFDTESLQDSEQIVLLPHSSLKHIQLLPTKKWSLLIVDYLETIVNSRYLKSLQGCFQIGFVKRDFLCQPDKKLNDQILKWMKHEKHSNLVWCYPEHWLRLTWFNYEHEKPAENDIFEYRKKCQKKDNKKYSKLKTRRAVKKILSASYILEEFQSSISQEHIIKESQLNISKEYDMEEYHQTTNKNQTMVDVDHCIKEEELQSVLQENNIKYELNSEMSEDNPILNSLIHLSDSESNTAQTSPITNNDVLNFMFEPNKTSLELPSTSDFSLHEDITEDNPVLNLLFNNKL